MLTKLNSFVRDACRLKEMIFRNEDGGLGEVLQGFTWEVIFELKLECVRICPVSKGEMSSR